MAGLSLYLEEVYAGHDFLSCSELVFDLQLFAAEDEGRTEEPTEKKIREAREKGQVAKSQELPQSVVVIVGCLILFVFSSWFYDSCAAILKHYLTSFSGRVVTERSVYNEIFFISVEMAKILFPLFLAVTTGAIVAEVSQVGFQFTPHPLKMDWSKIKIDPASMVRKIFFSKQVGMNLFKSIFKVSVIGFVAYLIISADFDDMMKTPDISVAMALKVVLISAFKIVIWSSVFLLALSVPDYIFQKRELMESLKMTKQEVKEELKETMGDPHVRARMREMQRDIMMRSMINTEVPGADVVVTNPTHFAVALRFDKATMSAPMVVAKGVDSLALKIREVARANGVEIVENRTLAQEMYKNIEVGDIIPENLYKAVVAVYQQIKDKSKLKKAI